MKNGYLKQAWLVLALAVVFGACLAGVESGLSGRIAANKRNETFDQIPVLVPGADAAVAEEWETSEPDKADRKAAYKAFAADEQGQKAEHLGWVIKAAGQGFADKIELLIGLDVEAKTITGLFVLAQKETPALGSEIASKKKPWFRQQFKGKSATDLITVTKGSPTKGANEVASLSGATVSSVAVTKIVNKAVRDFRKRMGELQRKD